MTLCFSLPDLHVMGKDETSQAEEVTVILVLDVDCPPGVLPAPHSLAILVLTGTDGSHTIMWCLLLPGPPHCCPPQRRVSACPPCLLCRNLGSRKRLFGIHPADSKSAIIVMVRGISRPQIRR